MSVRKSQAEFEREVYGLTGDEYLFLEPYVNNKTKILCKHMRCGHEWRVSYGNFKNSGSRCPKCRYSKMAIDNTKSNSEFLEEIYELVGDEYTPLDEYSRHDKEVRMRHNICGNLWLVTPTIFTSHGQRCPDCTKVLTTKRMRKGTSRYKEEVKELVGSEYSILGRYGVDNKEKVKTVHTTCGHVYYVSPHEFLSGRRCPKCFGTPLKTQEEFEEEVHSLVGDEYSVVGKYVSTGKPIEIKHNTCGKVNNVTPNSFLRGSRCFNCNRYLSKGESAIEEYLKDNDVYFEKEYRFEDLKNSHLLRFDFAVLDGSEIKALIEYDGIQHFEPVDFFGGDSRLEYQKRNDALKNSYCRENNLKLIRIPYWDYDNIGSILKKEGVIQWKKQKM